MRRFACIFAIAAALTLSAGDTAASPDPFAPARAVCDGIFFQNADGYDCLFPNPASENGAMAVCHNVYGGIFTSVGIAYACTFE